MQIIGKGLWLIPDMYWPEISSKGQYISHESICVLNTSEKECEIEIDLYYEDRAPLEGLKAICSAKRTKHIRMDQIKDENGNRIPRGVPYAGVVKSSIPIVVQYTRVDTTQKENALMTTLGYSV